MAIMRQPDDKTKPELIDYETAMFMMPDLHGREPWSMPFVLAQWVALIRQYERNRRKCEAGPCDSQACIEAARCLGL